MAHWFSCPSLFISRPLFPLFSFYFFCSIPTLKNCTHSFSPVFLFPSTLSTIPSETACSLVFEVNTSLRLRFFPRPSSTHDLPRPGWMDLINFHGFNYHPHAIKSQNYVFKPTFFFWNQHSLMRLCIRVVAKYRRGLQLSFMTPALVTH